MIGQGKTFNNLPVVEDVLGEGLSLGVSSEHASEAERLRNGQVCFHLNKIIRTKLRGVPEI